MQFRLKHFIVQLMHTTLKNVELLKHFKIRKLLQHVSVYKETIYNIYNKPTRCNSGSIVFIKNYKYALHVSDALCVHLQEHCKL